nr:immunoglobulin heavy chain junction region [Mus musculus]
CARRAYGSEFAYW